MEGNINKILDVDKREPFFLNDLIIKMNEKKKAFEKIYQYEGGSKEGLILTSRFLEDLYRIRDTHYDMMADLIPHPPMEGPKAKEKILNWWLWVWPNNKK